MAKTYIYKGKVLGNTLPDPFHHDGGTESPMTDDKFISYGGVIEDDGEPTPFEAACAQFRQVCAAMGAFLKVDNFHGGFDEYTRFATSPEYQANPVLGNSLAIQWAGTNEYCKYEGAKIGLGQPDWWKKCWEMADATQSFTPAQSPTQNSESSEVTPASEESNESNDAEPAATEGE